MRFPSGKRQKGGKARAMKELIIAEILWRLAERLYEFLTERDWKKANTSIVAAVGSNPGVSLRLAIVDYATSEVGTLEAPSNSGTRVREYQAATWLEGTGWKWCGAFVCWCIGKAAKSTGSSVEVPNTPRAYEFRDWAEKNILCGVERLKPDAAILPGDIVIYEWSHVGIAVSSLGSGRFLSVEGNVSGDDGGPQGVHYRTRTRKGVTDIIRLPER